MTNMLTSWLSRKKSYLFALFSVFILTLIDGFQMEKQVIEDESGKQKPTACAWLGKTDKKQLRKKQCRVSISELCLQWYKSFLLCVRLCVWSRKKEFTYSSVLHQTYKIVKQ